MVLPDSDRISRVPPYSGTDLVLCVFIYGTITLYGMPFQAFLLTRGNPLRSAPQPRREIPSVWALPISLATTFGISIDLFSSRYLDVSVPQVRLTGPWIQPVMTAFTVGFPHSGTSGSPLLCQLPGAFRRLTRPSSPPTA